MSKPLLAIALLFASLSTYAVELDVQGVWGTHIQALPEAGDLHISAVSDVAEVTFTARGGEVIFARTVQTATMEIVSQPSRLGRVGHVTSTQTTATPRMSAFRLARTFGWVDSDNITTYRLTSSTSVPTFVVRLPNTSGNAIAKANVGTATVPINVIPGPYPNPLTGNNLLEATAVAGGSVGDFTFPITGRELILMSAGSGGGTFTFHSQPDELGRTGDIEDYALDEGDFALYYIGQTQGWADEDGNMRITTGGADPEVVIYRLP